MSTPPSVLINDPSRGCAYEIPADKLESFRVPADAWASVQGDHATFSLPKEQAGIERIPTVVRALFGT